MAAALLLEEMPIQEETELTVEEAAQLLEAEDTAVLSAVYLGER